VSSPLQANPELSQWVEVGYSIHKHLGVEDCEFCGGLVSADRWKQLQSYFNTEDQQLRDELRRSAGDTTTIERGLDQFRLPDRLAFSPELRETFDAHKGEWDAATGRARMALHTVAECLAVKNGSRSTPMSCEADGSIPALRSAFSSIEALINRHNEKTHGFELAKSSARTKLEQHYLASIKAEVLQLMSEIDVEDRVILDANTER
jgi:wobble nucleotide-excising tRNase